MRVRMEKETITLEVPAETAAAYKRASEPARRRAERALTFALQTADQAAAELEVILDRIGRKAQERGLTEERLNELLDEE